MKARVKRLYSPDVANLETYVPDDEACFGFLLQVMVGPDGSDGEESFDMVVCTPAWLSKKLEREAVMFGRHHLLVKSYDYTSMLQALRRRFETIEERSWQEIALKVSRDGRWEFEDYKE